MKAQDIVVLAILLSDSEAKEGIAPLAVLSGLSLSETHGAIKRLGEAGLMDAHTRKPKPAAALEFFLHGLKYVFPVKPGPRVRGVGTAHSAAPLKMAFGENGGEPWVWPWEKGRERGESIKPLYKTTPRICAENPKVWELLALLDGLRAGSSRVRKLAADEVTKRLLGSAHGPAN